MYEPIQSIKPLTTDQYQATVDKAIARVKHRIGSRPTKKNFQREQASAWSILDALAIVIFIAALVISSAHIITHMGKLADTSWTQLAPSTNGIALDQNAYTIIHQVSMIFLAEASMLLFMVMHGMSAGQRTGRLRMLSLPLVLALIAAMFVFISNWQSGIGLLEALMPPIFTVGIGLRLEYLIVYSINRQNNIDQKYHHALDIYDQASLDPQSHPDYMSILKMELWSALVAINRDYREAPMGVRQLAVRRELERDLWTKLPDQALPDDWQTPRLKPPPTLPRLIEEDEDTAPVVDRNQRAREILEQNPGISVRDFAAALGVGKSTGHTILTKLRETT